MGFQTIEHRADLCVVGGGLAGMCAAVAAARGGSRVALVHKPIRKARFSLFLTVWT